MDWLGIMVTAVCAALAQIALHYAPWNMALGRRLPRLAAYALGVLGMAVPLAVLLIAWQRWDELIAGALVIGASGAAVGGAYALDHVLRRMALARDLAELERLRHDSAND